jgi:hypothetical protein
MTNQRFSSYLYNDEITTRRYRALIFVKYITIMIVEFTVLSDM